ncbi:MAG: DsbA family protein [Deltaproteobacteria bacterium]|nr:DsbA family protein [Deltaproteobacteria bacterium]
MEWLYKVRASSDGKLRLVWKSFLLEQINSTRGPEWKVWEDEGFKSRDLPPLEAAKCAALQGEAAFDAFHQRCFRARHRQGRSVAEKEVLLDVAREAGLDVDRFRRDIESGIQRHLVAEDHEEAVKQWGVFGVPTLVYPAGEAVYLKLAPGEWESREDDGLFDQLLALFATRPYLLEVKKPESVRVTKKR